MDEVMTVADSSGTGATSFASSPSSNLLPSNLPLVTAFLAFALAQFLKLFTNWFKERRWDSKRMIDSGGMPSSHSATVTALAVAIGLQDGTGGPAFAIAVVLACVVMYDASGVRLHAGRQAELLNQIVCEFPPEHPLSSVRPLRELLGHTPLQVLWGATSMIEAERLLIEAVLDDPANQRFVLLSDSCIPLYNFSYVYSYLMSSPNSFVDSGSR
ncbi:uncharacterized protein LOC111283728 isoform X1 [Durio zibethinus]|uniref:Uncharacterized protein LOC111283728 isoform X1 n=1 Tax=Durio zibethinus TaxID=66656 RepID=A0A6P5XIQ4_DURZI|nr:uncharacterized protein LOC111283728 isoform X1 [Durio zibethinus]